MERQYEKAIDVVKALIGDSHVHVQRFAGIAVAITTIILAMRWVELRDRLALNVSARLVVLSLAHHEYLPVASAVLNQRSDHDCRANWLRGFVTGTSGDIVEQRRSWAIALRCSPNYVRMLKVLAPNDRELAQLATSEQPDEPEAWFWAARIRAKDQLDEAVALYHQGLHLNPTAAVAWRELADLLAKRDPQAAMHAYLQSCLNGDPGWNACTRAGQLAEQQGDVKTAIQLYRLSGWPPARERAYQLERQVAEQR